MGSPTDRERVLHLTQEAEWRKCKTDWLYWLSTFVWTKDENDRENPFKPFVDREEGVLPYVRLLGDLYLRERRLIILKSRQLRVTWLCCALDLWEAMFHPGRFIPITAYKEGDAADILARIEFIYQGLPNEPRAPGLPTWMRDRCRVRFLKEPFEMQFLDNGSLVRAVPEGDENLRGKTLSRWRNEESRSQPRLEKTSQSVLPTTQGGGQVVFVSSAGAGYFQALVEDRIDPGDPPEPEAIPCDLIGVKVWRNRRNGYLVVRIHYTADPSKRDPAWIKSATQGMADYQVAMEYEIDFTARGGQPALPFFTKNQHLIVIPPRLLPDSWPRFASADYGTTNPYSCHFHAIDPDGNLYTYWEYYSPGALGDHLEVIKAHPDWSRILKYILDRSCWSSTQQVSETVNGQTLHAVRSVADLHIRHGVNPLPATVTSDGVKIDALADEWNRDKPRSFIFATCSNLLRELPQQRWAERPVTANSWVDKLVDRDNHAFDDYCYAVMHHRNVQPEDVQDQPVTSAEAARMHTQGIRQDYLARVQAKKEGLQQVEEDYGYVH